MRLSSRHQFSQNTILLSGFQLLKSKSCVFLSLVQIFHLVKVWERKEREMKWDCGLWPRPVQGTVTGSKLRSETLLSWRTVSLLAPGPWLHHGQGHQVWIDTVHTGPKRPSRQKSVVCVLIISMDTVLIIVTQLYNQFDWSPLIISDVTNLRPLSLSLYACLYFIEWNINFTFSQDYDLQDWMIINMSHQGVYNQTVLTTFCFMIQYNLMPS